MICISDNPDCDPQPNSDPQPSEREKQNVQQLDREKIVMDLERQKDELERNHKENMRKLESELYQEKLNLENAERGFRDVDYSKIQLENA